MLAGLYVVRCYISCLPRLCSVLLHGEKKHKKWFMNINEQAGIPNLKVRNTRLQLQRACITANGSSTGMLEDSKHRAPSFTAGLSVQIITLCALRSKHS